MILGIKFLGFDFCHRPKMRLVPGVLSVTEQVGPPPEGVYRQEFHPRPNWRLLMTFQMTDSQQSVFKIQAKDKKGKDTPLPPGSVSWWFVDSTGMLALTLSVDGSQCTVVAVGPLGTAIVSVKVSDGQGNTLAAGSIDVTIVTGAPTTIAINPDVPTEQP